MNRRKFQSRQALNSCYLFQNDTSRRNQFMLVPCIMIIVLTVSFVHVCEEVDAFQSSTISPIYSIRRSILVSKSKKSYYNEHRYPLLSSIQRLSVTYLQQCNMKELPTSENEISHLCGSNDISSKTISSRFLAGLSISSRTSYYKRSVVGSDGGRPQITALDMVVCSSNDEDVVKQLDKNDFEIHVGRALDTLRKDYPKILQCEPNYSIYDSKIDFIDPSGVKLHGLSSYKRTFRLLHTLIMIVACPSKSGIQMRMCYDQARQNIRIHWNAHIVLRDIFGGSTKTNYIDGISVYDLDRYSGNITQHRIERLLINDVPLAHEQGIIAALQEKHAVVLPNFSEQLQPSQLYQSSGYDENFILAQVHVKPKTVIPFQQTNQLLHALLQFGGKLAPSSLFALEASNGGDGTASFGGGTSNGDIDTKYIATLQARFPALDWNAYENKNRSRQKFGLKPLTPEEFLDIESKVHQLAKVQEQKIAEQQLQQQLQQEDANAEDKKRNKVGDFFGKIFSNVLKDTCETNYDCERPEICCDFGFQKRCCFSGSPVGRADWSQMIPIRVAADMDNYPGMEGGGGYGQRNY